MQKLAGTERIIYLEILNFLHGILFGRLGTFRIETFGFTHINNNFLPDKFLKSTNCNVKQPNLLYGSKKYLSKNCNNSPFFQTACCWTCVACREDSIVAREDLCLKCAHGEGFLSSLSHKSSSKFQTQDHLWLNTKITWELKTLSNHGHASESIYKKTAWFPWTNVSKVIGEFNFPRVLIFFQHLPGFDILTLRNPPSLKWSHVSPLSALVPFSELTIW